LPGHPRQHLRCPLDPIRLLRTRPRPMSHRCAWPAMRGAAASGGPAHGGLMDLLPIGVGDRLLTVVMVGVRRDRTGVGGRRDLTGAGSSLARPQSRPPGRLSFERSLSQQTVYGSSRTFRSDPAGKSFGAVFLGACASGPDQRCGCFRSGSIFTLLRMAQPPVCVAHGAALGCEPTRWSQPTRSC
jgi:hypothetical protein